MKRRLLSAFLAVMMVLTMAPVAFAGNEAANTVDDSTSAGTGSAVAKIGDTGYATLAAAVAAANNGETVTLLTNTAEDITIAQDKNITLDLGSNTLTNNGGDTITVELGATLTITGNSEDENKVGTVDNVTNGKADIVNNGTVILNGGWYLRSEETGKDSNTSGGNSYYNILNHGVMTINNDTMVMQEGKFSSLIVNGYYDYAGGSDSSQNYVVGINQAAPKLTINNGVFVGGVNTIKNDDGGELIINGGGFGNYEGCAVMNNNTATINGGRFIAEGNYVLYSRYINDAVNTGKLTVTDGEFKGNLAQINNAPIAISGGTFTTDPTKYLADGYMSPKIGDSYKVGLETDAVAQIGNNKYTTLQDAFQAATKGDTVKLLTDVHTNGTDSYDARLVIRVPITLDLNEHTIYSPDNMGNNNTNFVALNVAADTTLKATTGGIDTGKNGGYAINVYKGAKLTIDGGKYYGGGTAVQVQTGELTINDGYFDAEAFSGSYGYNFIINCIDSAYKDGTAKVAIKGGYFAHFNPANNKAEGASTNFVADGYVAATSDKSGYDYKVVAKTNTGSVEVKPAVADPEVKVDRIPQADKEKVAAAAATVSAPTLGAAAVDEAQKISEDKANELLKDVNVGDGVKKLYVQSSLKVEPTAYNETTKTLALDITPQYRVVASTATKADEIKLDGDTKNAQVVQDYQNMTINTPTEVTMELPAGFAVADGAKLSIKHTKSNGTVEYYTGTVTEQSGKPLLTFTTNGFSPFVISVPAAAIESKVYPTLQAAVDSAKNGDIIDLYKDVAADTKVTVAKTINFKVDANKKKFDAKKNIVAGTNTTVKVGETNPYTYEFTYTKPSSGGSSGGSSSGKTTYKVTTSAVNNGGVNASPSSAEKGAAITITLSPDKGYKLDKLTVTDGSGKTVSTVKKSDTVYTFTMPASAVKVGVSYVKATETPSETKFNDVSANDWFASAVDYVTGKGMMNGTADNTFSPKANTTRGMVVTVLYRLENQPSTSAASFTDVASGAYYANAVAWANANGIVSGYGSGKFGPNDKVTREQLAAILYRYAQYKKYDVSGANSLDGYTDAQSVSSYAVPALQWANAAGVVTGKSGNKLDPKGNATRAEVAAMLMRFCENVK